MPIFKVKRTEEMSINRPKFYPLDVENLKLAAYQRVLRISKVVAYAENFDPDIFGIILVSHRDGEYWIVDGQHRIEVAKRKGIKSVWCQVLEGLTYEEEALKFYTINHAKSRLNANHKFHALVEAREENVMEIMDALNHYHFTYSKEGCEIENDCINAVGSIRKIHKDLGQTGLMLILEILRKAWNGDKTSLRAEMIKGVKTFVTNYEFDKDFLISVLEGDTPKGIIDRARAYTNNIRRPSDGCCFHIAKTIRDMYEDAAIRTKGKVGVCTCKIA